MENFYELLRKNEQFSVRDLLILGLLLSNGLARQKARLFFEIFDDESNDQLSKSELEAMIDDIARFSIRLLPKLVDNSTNPPVSRMKVALYAKELDQIVPNAKENLISSILGSQETIRTHEFANLFNNDENGQLLTPHGFRKFVLNS